MNVNRDNVRKLIIETRARITHMEGETAAVKILVALEAAYRQQREEKLLEAIIPFAKSQIELLEAQRGESP